MMNYDEVFARLEDIAEQTGHITSVVQSMTFQEFAGDVVRSAAVIRFFEVIGEAAKYVPDSFREEYPEVEWRELAGFRDVSIPLIKTQRRRYLKIKSVGIDC